MSGRDDEAVAPSLSGSSHVLSDTESGSSYVGSAAPDTPACPYQNTEFFGNECSRYHDCPTHMAERSTAEASASGSATTTIGGQSGQSVQPEVTPEHSGPVEEGTNPEGSGAEIYIPIPEQVPASGTQLPQVETHSSASGEAGPSELELAVPQSGHDQVPQEQGITLTEALRQTAETLGELPSENVISSRQELDARPTPPASRNVTTHTMNLPENQQQASSLNPIATEFSPRPETRSAQEFALPRWQPDSEVTYCPICRNQFSFFVRKHHCRKCGRVVCNSCSPHRITIPHQYIVRPPGERALQYLSVLGDEGGLGDFHAIGGGEQVRLCNPCVPDPNTTPPQTQHSTNPLSPRSTHQRSQSSSSGNHYSDNNLSRYPPYLAAPSVPHDAYARNRSLTMTLGPAPSVGLNSAYPSIQNRIMSGTPPSYYSQPYSQQYGTYRPSGRSSSPNALNRLPRAFINHYESNAPYGSSSSSSSSVNRPLPPPPQIPEEDECPVCHRELPSRNLPNFEALRESHITSCITSHSTYGPGPDASGRSGSREPRTPRRTGMFPYLATEKDCVDTAECTICLEEFVVGVPMARLECLCRFHRLCITQWFINHPGRCPVHHALQY
ncbi:FYVE-domain-containing protein [Hypoxylon cercidicola]|nr:FYVE-domain-containing protein [Hypoxylon cercidicola]